MSNFLYIDTAKDNLAFLILIACGKIFVVKKNLKRHLSEILLPAVDDLFKKAKLAKNKLDAIAVVNGPGAFSSLRCGIILANTFGWVLKIPVVAIGEGELAKPEDLPELMKKKLKDYKKFKPVVPSYGREPNITQPKS
jgi:tRNA threonylcarbamoyl adenosine modification protein YeaZ